MTYYTRAQWGAAPPTRSMARLDPKRVRYWTLHFDGSGALGLRDLRTLMRAFQRYHQQTRGFADIAYNSGAGQSGDRAEGRGAYVGGHLLASQNAESWGCIAAVGATEVPTPALLAALREDYEAACEWAGRRLIPRGHTQWPDANKSCPGTHLMRFLTTLTLPPKPAPPTTTTEEPEMITPEDRAAIANDVLWTLVGFRPDGARNLWDNAIENLRQSFALRAEVAGLTTALETAKSGPVDVDAVRAAVADVLAEHTQSMADVVAGLATTIDGLSDRLDTEARDALAAALDRARQAVTA